METSDPYRDIARFFPAFDRLVHIFLPRMRSDLFAFLRHNRLVTVLDLGCGAGGLSRELADRGFSPVCVDVSPAMLARAEERSRRPPPFAVVRSDGGTIPLAPGMDASVMRFVLHEMSPEVRLKVLGELLRVVRPGGYLLFIDFILPADACRYPGWRERLGGSLVRVIESQMKRVHSPHYENYRDLMEKGGTLGWARKSCGQASLLGSYFGGNIGLVAARVP